MSEHPDLILERLRLGELDPAARRRVEAGLGPAEQARIEAMREDDARLLQAHPPRVVALEIERRFEASRPVRPRPVWTFAAVGALAAACVALFALNPGATPDAPRAVRGVVAPVDTVRAKGDARLLVYRQTSAVEPEMLSDGDRAAPGDLLQLGVLLDTPRHVVVLSIDGRGAVTHHYTSTGLAEGKVLFDHAFALDDAPDFERFVVVTAAEPIDPAIVESAAKARAETSGADRAPLSLPDGLSQLSTLIRKETP